MLTYVCSMHRIVIIVVLLYYHYKVFIHLVRIKAHTIDAIIMYVFVYGSLNFVFSYSARH
jgi:hypothetical protein